MLLAWIAFAVVPVAVKQWSNAIDERSNEPTEETRAADQSPDDNASDADEPSGSNAPQDADSTLAKPGDSTIEVQWDSALRFESNRGQVHERAQYLGTAQDYSFFINSHEVFFASIPNINGVDEEAEDGEEEGLATDDAPSRYSSVVRMHLVGADEQVVGTGLNQQPGLVHYLVGSEPSGWVRSVPQFEAVEFIGVYPGINVAYYGSENSLAFDFVVEPGSNPDDIRLRFEGSEQLTIDDRGNLVIGTSAGEIRLRRPTSYQFFDGRREQVPSSFVSYDDHEIGFSVPEYDPERPLLIDPTVSYSAIISSEGRDFSFGAAATPDGDSIVAGEMVVPRFPAAYSGDDPLDDFVTHAFVAKIDAGDRSLDYITFLGGDNYDSARGVASDNQGFVYVTGKTRSHQFPVTSPIQESHAGGATDVFASKLALDGSDFVFSTYLGGEKNDNARAIVVDSMGDSYVTGETQSETFPTLNAFQPNLAGSTECFVSKVTSNGESIAYSTFLGGGDYDACRAIGVDPKGFAYVTGATASLDFPRAAPVQPNYAGGIRDGFASKLTPDGTQLVFSTYLGGGRADHGRGIAADNDGNAYVTGKTASEDFPLVQPFQPSRAGGRDDAFVIKLSADGTAMVYSSYLGGSGREIARSMAVDSFGNAYITGRSSSDDYPVAGGGPNEFGPGTFNAFLAIVEPEHGTLVASRLIGGSRGDRGLFIALDSRHRIHLSGHTLSSDFPGSTEKSIFGIPRKSFDVFIAVLEPFASPEE